MPIEDFLAKIRKPMKMVMKMGTLGFLRSLISNLKLFFQKPKWRIQYGGPKVKKLFKLVKVDYKLRILRFLTSLILNLISLFFE